MFQSSIVMVLHVQFVNSAVSATTSSYTSQCVGDFVPQDADLVFVEFAVNDWEALNPNTTQWMDNGIRYTIRFSLSNHEA
jgi:hypothetical protein